MRQIFLLFVLFQTCTSCARTAPPTEMTTTEPTTTKAETTTAKTTTKKMTTTTKPSTTTKSTTTTKEVVTDCNSCTADQIELVEGNSPPGAGGEPGTTTGTLGAVTTMGGCAAVVATCALPDATLDGIPLMELNGIANPDPADGREINGNLYCKDDGLWYFNFNAMDVMVDQIACQYLEF